LYRELRIAATSFLPGRLCPILSPGCVPLSSLNLFEKSLRDQLSTLAAGMVGSLPNWLATLDSSDLREWILISIP
jgi:hypothetical protein